MADGDELLLPVEIPWKLASTTQPFEAGEAAETSISLFFHEPEDETLTSLFPDEKLVFLKFTVSVSPASFPAGDSPAAAGFLGEGVPCFHLLLDLKVRRASEETGAIRPYFHAAAPLNRRMIQTGIVGGELFEGEADAQSIGKSGSHLYEALSSTSKTRSSSAGLSLFGIGGSVRTTSTDVSSTRSVDQVVDTTTRQASEERRELISHLTKVENVLTLLNAKYVGTPYLSFSLAPQPLQLLSIDPSDPNLWFNQLLHRRSSGIEGIQEFTTVVVVPRNESFCVNARLRRVCLLDDPPGPFTLEERFNGTLVQFARMVNFLNRIYPQGTPLEELDIDLIGALTPADEFRRPVVELWAIRSEVFETIVISPGSTAGNAQHGGVNYKTFLEVWLDTLRDEYEREVARSPLERGILLGENRVLDTCFARGEGGPLEVSGSSWSVSPLTPIEIPPRDFDIGGVKTTFGAAPSVRSRAFETITRWNALEQQVATILANRKTFPENPSGLDNPRIVRLLVDRWAKMSPDDSRNLPFDQAADALHLSPEHRRLLQQGGATDLRSIASTIKAAPDVERHNNEVRRVRRLFKSKKVGAEAPDPIEFAVSAKDSEEIRNAIAAGLKGKAE
jgi:hypothetical protein